VRWLYRLGCAGARYRASHVDSLGSFCPAPPRLDFHVCKLNNVLCAAIQPIWAGLGRFGAFRGA
jgi:hypothetical protein